MNKTKKILLFILDWTMLIGTVIILSFIFIIDNFSTSWKMPIFLNAYILTVMIYVKKVHKENNVKTLEGYSKFFIFMNIILLFLQLTIGISGRYNHGNKLVNPIYEIPLNYAIEIILVYASIFIFLIILNRLGKLINKKISNIFI